jgi:hypothetical protein
VTEQPEHVDVQTLRETVDSLVGSFRLYLAQDIESIRPLVEPFSLDDLWSAFCYLASSCSALDEADNDVVARRLAETGAMLRDLNPNPDPPMSAALLDVASALEGTTLVDADSLDIGELAGRDSLNAYPYVMALCLALSIAHVRWSGGKRDGIPDVLDDVVRRVNTNLDYAEVFYQEARVKPFEGTRSPQQWIDGVTTLSLILLDWDAPGRDAEVAEFLSDKQPIEVGPFIMESLIAVASATANNAEHARFVLNEMGRLGAIRPVHPTLRPAVDALTEALARTRMHPTEPERMFTPIGAVNAASNEEFMAAAAHVITAFIESLPGDEKRLRLQFVNALRRAAQ